MNKGTYPTYWNESQISPIFKDGNKSDVTCYRAISLLNCMSKVVEMIFAEIYELVRHKLCENQFGFRKNRSATLQLLLFLDTVYKKLDNEAITLYIYILNKKKNTLLTITVITSNRGFNNCYNTAWSVVIYFST